jgi:hypothetical protein
MSKYLENALDILSEMTEAKKMKGKDPCWDGYEMIGTKKKNGKEVPNCVPKNEEVEIYEAKVGDTVSFHHELKAAPGTKMKKSGTVEKVENDTVHVKVKDRYGVKRHQVKMSDIVKEEAELEEAKSKAGDGKELHVGIEAYGVKGMKSTPWRKRFKSQDAFEKWLDKTDGDVEVKGTREINVNEEVDQIDELKKSTLLRYTTKANKSSIDLGVKASRARDNDDMETWAKNRNKADNRDKNIMKARRKLSEEEIELDEAQLAHKVMYAMKDPKKGGKIAVAHYEKEEDAKKFLDDIKKKGGHGIIRKNEPKNEEVDLGEVSLDYLMSKDYVRKAEGSRNRAAGIQKTYGYSKEYKEKMNQVEKKREKGLASYSTRYTKANPTPKYNIPVPKDTYPLGGYDPVSRKSYSEESKVDLNQLFTEAMKKDEESSKKKVIKKGEQLSGKQEVVKVHPEIPNKN